MCGIVAIIDGSLNSSGATQAIESLYHRGPDAFGQWRSSCNRVWLGHRRLSIIDLSNTGNQPLSNEDNSVWLICNGEIYNYPLLRELLEDLGHRFRSASDSEVIIHAYEAWGNQCVERLEGMFAFALWDDRRKRLLAARDRVGIKPLYYSSWQNRVFIASEARALLPLISPSPALEPLALAYYMTLGYIPSPWSIWHGVLKLEAGHFLTWQEDKGLQVHRYWDPPRHIDSSLTFDLEEWEELFSNVLSQHLLSDVPIGLFLSGGIDSTTVAAGLHDLRQQTKSITVAYHDSIYNEAPIARAVSEHLGLPQREVLLSVTQINELLAKAALAFDEPQGYSALLSMYLICEAAAKDFKVVLAGDGGDEIFGGYNWYRNPNRQTLRSTFRKLWSLRLFLRSRSFRAVNSSPWSNFASRSLLHHHASLVYPRFLPEEAEQLLAPTELSFGEAEMLEPLQKHYEPELPLRRALQRVDLMTFCSDSILAKVDRASMAHSLEVRVPLLDRRIIEWAFIRPIDRREASKSKPLLRDFLKNRVPSSVLDHPKQGFSLRVLDRFDWDGAMDFIRTSPLVTEGYLSPSWETFLQPHFPYREGRIWNLLMLSHWASKWLRRSGD